MPDWTEVITRGINGLPEKERQAIIRSRCGGLLYVPPQPKTAQPEAEKKGETESE